MPQPPACRQAPRLPAAQAPDLVLQLSVQCQCIHWDWDRDSKRSLKGREHLGDLRACRMLTEMLTAVA